MRVSHVTSSPNFSFQRFNSSLYVMFIWFSFYLYIYTKFQTYFISGILSWASKQKFGQNAKILEDFWHFHPIFTNESTKMTTSSRRIEWNKKLSSISLLKILVFGSQFCSKASHWQCCTYGLKTTLKLLVHVLAIMTNSYLKIVDSKCSFITYLLKFFLSIVVRFLCQYGIAMYVTAVARSRNLT